MSKSVSYKSGISLNKENIFNFIFKDARKFRVILMNVFKKKNCKNTNNLSVC